MIITKGLSTMQRELRNFVLLFGYYFYLVQKYKISDKKSYTHVSVIRCRYCQKWLLRQYNIRRKHKCILYEIKLKYVKDINKSYRFF